MNELLRSHPTEIGGFLLSFVVTRLLTLWTLTIVILPFTTALVAESGNEAAT